MISFPKIRAIFVKELRDSLRDRRTVFANFVIPLVLYPVMLLVLGEATQVAQSRRENDRYRVAVEPAEALAFINKIAVDDEMALLMNPERTKAPKPKPGENDGEPQAVDTTPRLVFEYVQDPRRELENRNIQAILRLPDDFEKAMKQADATGEPPMVEALFDRAEQRSRDAADHLHNLLLRYRTRVVKDRLKLHGIGEDLLKPFDLKEPENIAPAEKVGGSVLGALMPLWFIMMIILGAVHPAVDLTAGEKERSTLETLISAPVRPLEVISGKFLAVSALALSNAILNVLSFSVTFHIAGISKLPEFVVPWSTVPSALLLLLPLTLFFSALLMAVASMASSSKEAQVYCLPVFLVPMMGLMVVSIPGIELSGPLLIAPVVNTALLIKELFLGHEGLEQAYVFVLGSTCLYAAAAVGVAARVFAREEILFSSQASLRLFLSRRYFQKADQPRPADALLVAALAFPLMFYLQSGLMQWAAGASSAFAMATLLILPQVAVFLVAPLAIAWYLRTGLPTTFLWRLPTMRGILAALCLGGSSWIVVQQLAAWQSLFWRLDPSSMQGIELMLKDIPPYLLVVCLAVTPAFCEEHFFRGFLLSGLRHKTGRGKWASILLVAAIFAAFHLPLFRQPVVFLLGLALAYLAWESASLWPGVLFHLLHNGLSVTLGDKLVEKIPLDGTQPAPPPAYVAAAAVVFVAGLLLARNSGRRTEHTPLPTQELPAPPKPDWPAQSEA